MTNPSRRPFLSLPALMLACSAPAGGDASTATGTTTHPGTTPSSGDSDAAGGSSGVAEGPGTGPDSTTSSGTSSTGDPGTGGTTEGGSGGGTDIVEDAFGIAKIYADARPRCSEPDCVRYAGLDGRDIHFDIENLPSYDGEGENPLSPLGSDVWGVALDWSGTGSMQARLGLWSVDDDPWVEMEVTAFVKIVKNNGDAAIQPYVYGGRHSSTSDAVRCYGGAYKPKFRLSGDATIQKELCHSQYSSSHGSVENAWSFAEGQWYGFKSVAFPVEGGGVTVEMWFLQDDLGTGLAPDLLVPNEQSWVRLTQATDTGWKIGNDYCETACGTIDGTIFTAGNPVDEQNGGGGKLHTAANLGALRLDDVIAHIWGFSVRRIDPSLPL